MLTGGKLADMFGRRRIFFLGLALFTLSIIAPTFPARERGTALGIWTGVSARATRASRGA